MLGLGFDHHARAREPAFGEPVEQTGRRDPWPRTRRRRRASAGGSSSTCSTRSGGGATSTGGPGSTPRASSWNARPSTPKRASTASGGQRGDVAERAQPQPDEQASRARRRSNTATGHGARNSADAPGSITTAHRCGRAARRGRAVNSPSAIPTRTSASPSSASTIDRVEPLGQQRRRRRSSATDRASGTRTGRGGRARRAGVTRLDRARDELERPRFERHVGVDAHRRPGTGPRLRGGACRACTPSARASADAARTRSRLPTRSRTTTGTRAATGRAGAPRPPASRDTRHSTCGWSAVRSSPSPRARRAALAPVRPSLRRATWRSRVSSRPLPASRPHHAPPSACTRTAASTGHGPTATSTDARSRARATSRRASPTRNRGGTVATTSATPSSNAATTVLQRSAGQRRTTAHRSSSTPAAAAARAPSVPYGSTIAAHSPAAVAAAASANATVVTPAPSDTVDRDRRAAAHPAARQQLPERRRRPRAGDLPPRRTAGPAPRPPATGPARPHSEPEVPPSPPDRTEHMFATASGR